MGIFHPLRRTALRVTVTVLCLLVLSGVVPKLLPGWALKPLFGWHWFAFLQFLPNKPPRECVMGVVCVTGYLREALSQVENERTAIEAERDAFSEFAESVRGTGTLLNPSLGSPSAALVSIPPNNDQLRAIRQQYRETVMAVPQYEKEYNESFRENMTAELGDEMTTAILTGEQFTPQLKNLLVSRVDAATKQREALVEAIDAERDWLVDARHRLEPGEVTFETWTEIKLAEEPFETLVAYDRQSRRDEARCEKLLADRQRHVHRKTRWGRSSETSLLQEYLYRDFDVRFPVLYAGLERIKQLRERRRVVGRVIARLD